MLKILNFIFPLKMCFIYCTWNLMMIIVFFPTYEIWIHTYDECLCQISLMDLIWWFDYRFDLIRFDCCCCSYVCMLDVDNRHLKMIDKNQQTKQTKVILGHHHHHHHHFNNVFFSPVKTLTLFLIHNVSRFLCVFNGWPICNYIFFLYSIHMSICLLYMVIGHHRWIAYRIHYKIYEMDTKEIITYSFSGHNVVYY